LTGAEVSLTNEITISVWVLPQVNNLQQSLIRVKDAYLALTASESSGIRWYPDVDTTPVNINFSYSANTWHHIVVTQDANNNYVAYTDGKLAASGSAVPLDVISTTGTRLGNFDGLGQWDLDGLLDVPMVWNRALSASEVQQLYRDPFCMFRREPIELWSAFMGAGEALAVYVYDTE
jgi:hypothetical protein